MTEACSGRSGSFDALRWYRVEGASVKHEGNDWSGYYSPSGNYVVLSDSLALYGAGVRHEMLHALLGATGHPRSEFLEKCRDLVNCEGQCVEEAGKWVAPSTFVELAADSMIVSATPSLLPIDDDGDRWLTFRVDVQNPRGYPVLVVPLGSYTFGVDLRREDGGGFLYALPATDSSKLYFAAGETKSWLFEFRLDNQITDFTVTPGNYFLRGSFGLHWTDMLPVTATR